MLDSTISALKSGITYYDDLGCQEGPNPATNSGEDLIMGSVQAKPDGP